MNQGQLLLELASLPKDTAGTQRQRFLFYVNPSPPRPWRSLLLLHVATVVLATHNLELDTGQVLGAPALYKHNVVLLQGVALSRDKADGLSACAEPHAAALAVG